MTEVKVALSIAGLNGAEVIASRWQQDVETVTTETDSTEDRRARRVAALSLAALAVLFLIGLGGVIHVADEARDRDLDQWRLRLSIVAESRAEAIAQWLDGKRATVSKIAGNPSVQLYLTEITGEEPGPAAEAQRRYLRTLLTASAAQSGFESGAVADVPANIARASASGLLIVDSEGRLLAQSGAVARPDGLARLFQTEPVVLGDFAGAGPPLLMVSAPIHAVQADRPAPPLGWVVGLAPMDAAVLSRLHQPGETATTARSYLLRPDDNTDALVHIGRLPEGGGRGVLTLENPAARRSIVMPGRMVEAPDYRGTDVLAMAVPVSGPVEWWLMRSVDAQEALGAIDARRWRMILILTLGLGVLTALVLLAWRHGTGLRAARSARHLADLAGRHRELSRFLRAVTDHQPTEIIALDAGFRCRFANRRAAAELDLRADDMTGKTLDALYGPSVARPLIDGAQQAAAGEPVRLDQVTGDGDARRVYDVHLIPIRPAAGGAAILMVREEITDLVSAQEARQTALSGTIETLVTLIDARDPYAAAHSKRVAQVAGGIASGMKLSEEDHETLRNAALLLNLGKLLVPRSLLTRAGALSDAERAQVHQALERGADLIEHIDFDGPVVETLRQVWRHDPTRPDSPAALAPTARVLIVANAFVGMVSPRAYRAALSIDAAVTAMMDEAGKRYDRGVVAALVHHLDNEGGREACETFADMPDMPTDHDIG